MAESIEFKFIRALLFLKQKSGPESITVADAARMLQEHVSLITASEFYRILTALILLELNESAPPQG